MSAPLHLTAAGNACTDIVATVDAAFLALHGLRQSHSSPISREKLAQIKSDLPNPRLIPGGVGANVACVVASLGGHAAFLGIVGEDAEGRSFRKDLGERGVEDATSVAIGEGRNLGSPQVICLTTPDGDRSFASYEGVSKLFTPGDMPPDPLLRAAVVFFDGYTLHAERAAENFAHVQNQTRKGNGKLCLGLSDVSVIETFPDLIRHMVSESDALICNYAEARALLGDREPMALARTLAETFAFGALTHGENGAYVYEGGEVAFIPAPSTIHLPALDTNGAGDHFAGGFLYGRTAGWPLEKSGKLGQLAALDCLAHKGARPPLSLKHLFTD